MRRTVVTLSVVGLFVACGFPDVRYTSGTDGGSDSKGNVDGPVGAEGSGGDDAALDGTRESGDATSSGDGADSSTSGDTGMDARVTDADAMADAPGDSSADTQPADTGVDAPVDAPADVVDAAVDAPIDCDVDKDTFTATGAPCGGNDCCDTDNLAHPGQTTFFTAVDQCGSFDYDCNGALDPEYPINLKCGGTGLTGCTGGSAFIGDPGCGNQGLYGTCVPNGALACQAGNEMSVRQGCN